MRHIINENGMSLKLVQHCNESNIFLKEFVKLFKFDPSGIDYIQFTGDTPIEGYNLKPDITIRYNNGEKAYIEVKTNENTDYQTSQTENCQNTDEASEEKKSYIKLIQNVNRAIIGTEVKNPLYIKKHFGYLLDKNHYDEAIVETSEFDLPKVCWNDVYKKVLEFGYRSFGRDIKENVDGVIINDHEEIKITPYDMALLYNPKLFEENLSFLQDINYTKDVKEQITNSNLEYILAYNKNENIKNYFIGNKDGISFEFDKLVYETDKYNNLIPVRLIFNNMYWGWEPEILERKIIYKSPNTNIEDYLYSFAVDKEMLDIKKLKTNKIKYLEDEYRWIYFPLKKEYQPDITNIEVDACKPYNKAEQIRLCKLNICKSILCLDKMLTLFKKTQHSIINKLNEVNTNYHFTEGSILENRYIYIDIKNKEDKVIGDLISYGFMEDLKSDMHFLSICFKNYAIQKILNITPKILENSLNTNEWVYYPISPIILCKENYLETFTDEVVSIIKRVLCI